MLDNPTEQIRACYEHAGDCARKAARENDPRLKQELLDVERRWLALALTYKADIPMDLIRDTPQQVAWRNGVLKATIRWLETAIESHHLLAGTRAWISEAKREITDSRRLIEESRQLLGRLEDRSSSPDCGQSVVGNVGQNTNEGLSVHIFQEGTRFGWTLNSPTKELLGWGTAETAKKARIDAFEAGMTYKNHTKGRSAPTDTSVQ